MKSGGIIILVVNSLPRRNRNPQSLLLASDFRALGQKSYRKGKRPRGKNGYSNEILTCQHCVSNKARFTNSTSVFRFKNSPDTQSVCVPCDLLSPSPRHARTAVMRVTASRHDWDRTGGMFSKNGPDSVHVALCFIKKSRSKPGTIVKIRHRHGALLRRACHFIVAKMEPLFRESLKHKQQATCKAGRLEWRGEKSGVVPSRSPSFGWFMHHGAMTRHDETMCNWAIWHICCPQPTQTRSCTR